MRKKSFETIEKFYKSIVLGENFLNLPEDRISIYQTLVFNNIEDTCSKAFPITKSILKENWENLIRKFLKNHKFSTPYLWEVPKYFINYLIEKDFFENKEYLYELMIYEWIEIEIFNEDLPVQYYKFDWYETYRISNSARIFKFNYPVHKINQLNNIKEFKGNYFLVIYQNPENFEVEYLEITAFLYEILNNLSNKPIIELSEKLAKFYKVNFKNISNQLEEFFNILIENKIITI